MNTQIKSQKICILHKINKEKDILNRNVRLLKSMFISMHSVLAWASFCMNYCINAVWHGGNQPVALLRCNGSTGYFDNSLQENEISISIKLVSRRKHEVLFPGRWLRWLWTSENTVDQHQQMTWQPKSSLTVESSHWTSSNMYSVALHSSCRLWDLDFQMKRKIYFHLKRELRTTEQQSSSFSP